MANKANIIVMFTTKLSRKKRITEVKEMARSIRKRLHLQHLPDLALVTAKQNSFLHILLLTLCDLLNNQVHWNMYKMHRNMIMCTTYTDIRHISRGTKLLQSQWITKLNLFGCLDISIMILEIHYTNNRAQATPSVLQKSMIRQKKGDWRSSNFHSPLNIEVERISMVPFPLKRIMEEFNGLLRAKANQASNFCHW